MDAVTVRHEANDRFRISIRGHEIVVDQPAPASDDAGPTPTELFVASLAACAAFYARRFLARHGLADGGLVVRSDFGWAVDHSSVTSITLVVDVPGGVPGHLEAALLRAIERCTVHESIRNAPAVRCTLVKVPGPNGPRVGAAS